MTMRGRTFAAGTGLLVAGLVIAGFGNSKPTITEAKAAAATRAVMAGQASALPKLTLTLTKTSITVGGSKQSGATNVVSTATGLKEPLAILFLLKPTVSYADVEKFLKTKGAAKDPNTTAKYGSIVFDAEAPPGKANATQTYLQAGHYLALIPQEGKGPTPYTKFTVTAATSPAALPRPEATIRSIEFAFRGPKTLHDGELVGFENAGFLVHMDIAAPVANMNAAKEAVKDLLAGKKKKRPSKS